MKPPKADSVCYSVTEESPRIVLNRAHTLWILSFLCVFFCFVLFGGWYLKRHILIINIITECNDNSPLCTGVANLDKFDCHPEDGATKENCLLRGCCYDSKIESFPPLGVPFCFYPSKYDGYTLGSITQDGRHIKATLNRKTPSGFPADVLNLQLVITFISDLTLRIKITDATKSRFEVPIPINTELQNLKEPSYDVKLESETGQLQIIRKQTGTVIFKSNLSQMVYSNQFLQLSSNLPSPYIYGIGEHYESFLKNVNWKRLTIFNTDGIPTPPYPLYGSQPFYVSLEKGGNANGVFLFNSNSMDVILQPTPAITFRTIGGIFDFFVVLGPSPDDVVQQYTAIVGRTFMPPYWSLGFHLCRYGYNSLNKTRETTQRTIDASIPFSFQKT